MTPTTVSVTLMAIAGPLVLGYVFLVQVPSVQHSQFRHQLWALRDEMVDDLLARRLPRTGAVAMLLDLIEWSIGHAERHTMLAGWVAVKNAGHLIPAGLVENVILSGEGGPERAALAEYLNRYRRISRRHLMSGAPSGWVYVAFETLVRRPRRLIDRAVEVDMAESPVLRDNVMSGRGIVCA